MKSVLLSIQPHWCDAIANGFKTIEVRKTKPKLDVPFKCYIYCCKQSYQWFAKQLDISNHPDLTATYLNRHIGKVIGEWTCDKIAEYPYEECNDGAHYLPFGELEQTCLDGFELYDYLSTKDGYGWHISDLKIYDKPKELGEFKYHCINDCNRCRYSVIDVFQRNDEYVRICNNYINRPPQSWCYVDELEGESND